MTDVRHHGGMSTSPAPFEGPSLPDWGAGEIPIPRTGPGSVLLVGGTIVLGGALAFSSPVVGAVVEIVLLVALGVWAGTRGGAIIRDAGARPAGPHEAPRFENIATGLAAELGIDRPTLWLVEDGGANSFVAWRRGPHLGITRSVLTDLARTEVEAIVAHGLVRIASGEAKATTLAFALGPLAPRGARVGGALDVATAAVTRYPPALAAAVAKSSPRKGGFAAAWFAADDPAHVTPAERIAALEDL